MQTGNRRGCRSHTAAGQGTPKRLIDQRRYHIGAFFSASVLIIVMLWASGSVASAQSSFEASDLMTRGTVELGGAVGYAQGTTAIGHAQSANRSAVFVMPRVGMVLTDPLGNSWWKGNVELLVEPVFARFVQPFAAEAAGGSFVLKYNFLSFGRWVPFLDAGAGMIWTNLAPRIPEQSTQFEFVLETGPGVQYLVTDQITWTIGVRLHHISNANLGDRNTGINGVLPYVGISFFTPRLF
ncbi:MAG: acyloxyacyl hydrolase [Nitrospirae bacterium]|nr:acyloxyacyl hydrolase [Nitrospirota bacterium]MDE3041713.1 acyloxyacyl hydrolase [Nitrospirota bacterium]MDE3051598.1 acyloxyacyl hydrolase [Nitrospirota bacterium]